MLISHPESTFAYWGGIVSGPAGLLFAAFTVNEIKRARNSTRRITAEGRVVLAADTKSNGFGDVIGKSIDVDFTTVYGTRIVFGEDVNDTYAAGQRVTVHYDPEHPRDTATVLTPGTAFSRVLGYGVVTLLFLGGFVTTLFFNWN